MAKFAAGVADTGGNFAVGVIDTGGKFAMGIIDTGGATWLVNISANFLSKWAGGKLIHKKNQKHKISWQCPFNIIVGMKWCWKNGGSNIL